MKKFLLFILCTSSLAYASDKPRQLTVAQLNFNHVIFEDPNLTHEELEGLIFMVTNSTKNPHDITFRFYRYSSEIDYGKNVATLINKKLLSGDHFEVFYETITDKITSTNYNLIYGIFPNSPNENLNTELKNFLSSNQAAVTLISRKHEDHYNINDFISGPLQFFAGSNILLAKNEIGEPTVNVITYNEKSLFDHAYAKKSWLRLFKYHASKNPMTTTSVLIMLILGLAYTLIKNSFGTSQ